MSRMAGRTRRRPERTVRRRRRGRRRFVWHVVDWRRLYEPDPIGIFENSRYAALYLKEWINGSADGTVHRSEIEARKRAIIRAGGYELYGMWLAIKKLAGDREWRFRGYIVTHLDEPATEAEIGEILGLDAKTIGWALRTLRPAEGGVIERLEWSAVELPKRPSEANRDAADDAARGAAPHRPKQAETPPRGDRAGEAAQDPPTPTAGPGGPAGEGSGTVSGDGQDQEEDQGKDKGKATVLTDCGRTGCARKEKRKGQAPCEHTGTDVEGSGQGEGEADGEEQADGKRSGRVDDAGSGPPRQTRPGGEDGNQAEPADPSRSDGRGGGEPGGEREAVDRGANEPPRQTRPGGEDGEQPTPAPARPDEHLWAGLKLGDDPMPWRLICEGRHGAAMFGRLIYREMGLPGTASPHVRNQEIGAFREAWRRAVNVGLPEAWLLELCEKGIGKARQISDQRLDAAAGRAKEVGKPGAVWVSWFKAAAQDAAADYLRSVRPGKGSGPP